MQFTNIKSYSEFWDTVGILLEPEIVAYDLPCLPDLFVGHFWPGRAEEVLRICRENPEFHIVSLLGHRMHINGFVPAALVYYLADGDSKNTLIHDPYGKIDSALLQSLNSCAKRDWA